MHSNELSRVLPWLRVSGDFEGLTVESFRGEGDDARATRAEVAEYAFQMHPTTPVGELIPLLPLVQEIPYHLVPIRVKNCFKLNSGISTWSDLALFTIDDLGEVQNAGRLSVLALIELAIASGVNHQSAEATPMSPQPIAGRPIAHVIASPEGLDTIRLLAEWAQSMRSAGSLDDVVGVLPYLGSLPPDLAEALEELGGLALSDLVSAAADVDRQVTATTLLGQMDDERQHAVFCRRVLSPDPPTLRELGEELDITRERVRQVQSKAEEKYRALLGEHRSRFLRWRIFDLQVRLGGAYPEARIDEVLGSQELDNDTERPLLLWLAGPYKLTDGWFVRDGFDLTAALDVLHDRLVESAGVAMSTSVRLLAEAGIVESAGDDLVRSLKTTRVIGDQVFDWSGNVADKAVVVLELLGRPATDEEIVEHIGEGHSQRSLRNRLMEESRFMRTDRDLFGMRSWDLEEYSGISEEIAERIERAGGSAPVEDVVAELLSSFDVAESSVRQYAAAQRFIIENGFIRVRTIEEIQVSGDDPITLAGVYKPGPDQLVITIDVSADTLRGSGKGISRHVAVGLGVTPGEERVFALSQEDDLQVAWRLESASGPAIGSHAALALSCGAGLGDRMVIGFHTGHGTVKALVLSTDRPWIQLGELVAAANDADAMDVLSLALGVPRGAVRSTLRKRDDQWLLDLLPKTVVDDSLRAALEQLSGALRDED